MMEGQPVLRKVLAGPGAGARNVWGAKAGALVVRLGASAELSAILCAAAPEQVHRPQTPGRQRCSEPKGLEVLDSAAATDKTCL